ncbi:hypothetical protein [Hymenobacter properus]|uniref:Lipoprotein n=1 Tax=Hymenobacter properus TaxID=2791026 RepID=A0A931FLN0_9BACT|nr:hypothetical protein [Hymenobacter properus]MBF9140849.1 hypothetical protein [Hymenobacter properus]MBR7719658.1 hypothetical protein [Microvirga sp. SRT04]
MKANYLLPLALSLFGCSANSKPESLISDYVKAHATDASSYAPVSFSQPTRFHNRDIEPSLLDTTTTGTRYSHTYKIKNGSGAIVEKTHDFVIITHSQHVMQLPDSTNDIE